MPPKKLFLDIASPRRTSPIVVLPDDSIQHDSQSASVKVTENGSFNIFNKSQEFRFTPEGLFRRKGRKSGPSKEDEDQLSFKISDKDVQIIKQVGRGASSVVYKAYFARAGKYVAVKKIDCYEREKRRQMMNDVRALCSISDPNLVQLIGAYHAPEKGQIAIVLEYVNGGSLGDILQKVSRIPEDALSAITAQVLQGLSYLHRYKHTVHRDIKPANVLMDLNGRAKIADFGISAYVDNTLAVCHTFTGTVTYMSPERIDSQPYSFPADIWSLGLTLLEAATGRYPYDASGGPLELMIQVMSDPVPLPEEGVLSPELQDFILQCMRKDPFARPSAEALLSYDFILKHTRRRVDLKAFMRCMADEDAMMDEAAVQVTGRYYNALRGQRDEIASTSSALYTETSEHTKDGVTVRGREAIMQRLMAMTDYHSALGGGGHNVDSIHTQKAQGRTVLVQVKGHFQMGGSGPLAMGPQGAGPPTAFQEDFTICLSSHGATYILKQCYTIL